MLYALAASRPAETAAAVGAAVVEDAVEVVAADEAVVAAVAAPVVRAAVEVGAVDAAVGAAVGPVRGIGKGTVGPPSRSWKWRRQSSKSE